MKQTENLLRIASNSNISVLLQGESGSGKEVAARYVHDHSKRCNGPFVALNCGAIAHSLAESILEGSRKGAFTGAVGDQLGVVRAANGGTLFLDEIGEMPLEAQCKLLRILQERSVMPLGATTNIPVDFRLICATNRNLRQEVASGRFREDLYFRLNVFPIKVPALRERKDFAALAQDIWREAVYSQETTIAAPLSPQEVQSLAVKPWPGNVRQLKNVLQRYALLGPYGTSLGEILRDEFAESHDETQPRGLSREIPQEASRLYNPTPQWNILHEALQKNNWNKTVTAQKLGISRGSLCYHVRKHLDV